MDNQTSQIVAKVDEAARRERMISPQVVQPTKAVRHPVGGTLRKAYCKNDAGAANTIVCYLDVDETGEEITVQISICGGGDIKDAIGRLSDGDLIFVSKFGDTWYCVGSPFNAACISTATCAS